MPINFGWRRLASDNDRRHFFCCPKCDPSNDAHLTKPYCWRWVGTNETLKYTLFDLQGITYDPTAGFPSTNLWANYPNNPSPINDMAY